MLILPAALLLLTACDVETKNPTEAGNRVSLNADASGRVAFDFPFAQGEIKLPAAMMENSQFDIDGVKLIPGGKITGFRVDSDNGPAKVDLTFSAPAAPQEVRANFLQQFREKGVNAAAAGETIAGTAEDGTAFVMRFAPQGSGTTGSIVLHPREGSSGR